MRGLPVAVLQRGFDPLACPVGEFGFGGVLVRAKTLGILAGGAAQQTDLACETGAEAAHHQVHADFEPPAQGKIPIHRFRDQSGNLATAEHR